MNTLEEEIKNNRRLYDLLIQNQERKESKSQKPKSDPKYLDSTPLYELESILEDVLKEKEFLQELLNTLKSLAKKYEVSPREVTQKAKKIYHLK